MSVCYFFSFPVNELTNIHLFFSFCVEDFEHVLQINFLITHTNALWLPCNSQRIDENTLEYISKNFVEELPCVARAHSLLATSFFFFSAQCARSLAHETKSALARCCVPNKVRRVSPHTLTNRRHVIVFHQFVHSDST